MSAMTDKPHIDQKAVVPSTLESHNLAGSRDVNRIEAPMTFRAYLSCGFAATAGLFFGYDSGYINGVTGSPYFIELVNPGGTTLTSSQNSGIVSILSAGTFFGAIGAGDLADIFGRRLTILAGCIIYTIGCILQIAAHGIALLQAGRFVAGVGVGFVSAIVILYMSEISPRRFRGPIVSMYQFAITIGLLLGSVVNYAVRNRNDTGSYRIPIGIQFLWAIILFVGIAILPDSPRFFVKKGKLEKARQVLARLRGQPTDSVFVEEELAEIVANYEYERSIIPGNRYIDGWLNCFSGSLWNPNSNLRKTIFGTSLQMMQQWTGINFIFYYSTPFLKSTGAIGNPFFISLIFNLINVVSTPVSFWAIEKLGRRPLLIYGAAIMCACEFIVGIVGVTVGFNKTHLENGEPRADNVAAVNAQIAFIAFYICAFAITWGPAAWVCIGETFPIPIRSRGVALSTASNWLWNCIIAVITPYLTNPDEAYLRSSVFFIWGSLCFACYLYAFFLVYETKGLSLEQVDMMYSETTPRKSSKWRPHETFAGRAHGNVGENHAPVVGHEEKPVV